MKRKSILISAGLILAIFLVFFQMGTADFIDFDDCVFVYDNFFVQRGLTWEGVKWALTTTFADLWHPLTWLSHMIDYEIFGLNAGGHHVTNILLHTGSTFILFFTLKRMGISKWSSAFVAALFSIHPLHVESVAWISERRDVLMGFFWMLTMWAYAGYAEKKGHQRYLLVIIFFTLGLISKPAAVTLPFALLLLDFWPLERFKKQSWPSLVWEKAPLIFFSLACSLITLTAHSQNSSLGYLIPGPRNFLPCLANSLFSYVAYIWKTIWPFSLSVFYPVREIAFSWVLLSLLLLFLITALVIWERKKRPYLIVGWLWYLGTLFPMSGLVSISLHSMADRYTYIPGIGLFLIMAMIGRDLGGRKRGYIPAFAILIFFTTVSFFQAANWQDSTTLFRHSLRAYPESAMLHTLLGTALTFERENSGRRTVRS